MPRATKIGIIQEVVKLSISKIFIGSDEYFTIAKKIVALKADFIMRPVRLMYHSD